MPKTVEMADAAERLDELVAGAEAGEEIVILREGAPVARLIGVDLGQRRASFEKTVEEIRACRAGAKPVTTDEFNGWKNEGRR